MENKEDTENNGVILNDEPMNESINCNNNDDVNGTNSNDSILVDKQLNNSTNSIKHNKLLTESAKKRKENSKNEELRLKREEEKRKKEEEKRKKDEEREKLRLEKEEEKRKREEDKRKKDEEREKLRLEKEEEKRKKDEEREKLKQEKLEKEKKRQELINAKLEEKKRKEEEKLKEEDEKRRKDDKIKQTFCSYFIKKEGPITQSKSTEEKNYRFLPFQLKENMHLAPICRRVNYENDKEDIIKTVDSAVEKQDGDVTYLDELKSGKHVPSTFPSTLRLEILIKADADCIEIDNKKNKFKVKYLHFDPREYRRPPYYGTWGKKSKNVRPRNPFGKDTEILDYEIDSDEEWEDAADGESIDKSDDEDEKEKDEDEDEEDDGFFVPHGYLSDDEIDEENRISEPNFKQNIEKIKQEEWEKERKNNKNHLTLKCVGCVWDINSVFYKDLIKYKMVPLVALPVSLGNESKNEEETSSKSNKAKQTNEGEPKTAKTPKSKQNQSQQKNQSTNNNTPQSTTNSSSNSTSNLTQSITKYISKLSNKKDKQISASNITETTTLITNSNCAEKRVYSDINDENSVKRLKLDNSTTDIKEIDNKNNDDKMQCDNNSTNKENNESLCITLE